MSTTQVTTFRRVCDCCGSQIGALEVAEITGRPAPAPVYQLGDEKRGHKVYVVDATTSVPVDVCDYCIERELRRSS